MPQISNTQRPVEKSQAFEPSAHQGSSISRENTGSSLNSSRASTRIPRRLTSHGALTERKLLEQKKQKHVAEAVGEIRAKAERLACTGKSLGDSGAARIAEALVGPNEILWLHLDHNNIGDTGATWLSDALRNHNAIRVLDLDYNVIGDIGAAALAKLVASSVSLCELDLHYNQISAEGAANLAHSLHQNEVLKSLSLHGNPITDAGAKEFAHALSHNQTLRELHLGATQMGDAGAQDLAQALHTNSTLWALHLGKNVFGDQSAEHFSKALAVNTGLRELWLLQNDISDEAASQLVQGVKGNAQLSKIGLSIKGPRVNGAVKDLHVQHVVKRAISNVSEGCTNLNLDGKTLGDEGVVQLVEGVKTNNNLKQLRLNKTGIGNVGARHLATALEHGELGVSELDLEENRIGDPGAVRLAQAVEQNQRVDRLSLKGNEGISQVARKRLNLASENTDTLMQLTHRQNDDDDLVNDDDEDAEDDIPSEGIAEAEEDIYQAGMALGLPVDDEDEWNTQSAPASRAGSKQGNKAGSKKKTRNVQEDDPVVDEDITISGWQDQDPPSNFGPLSPAPSNFEYNLGFEEDSKQNVEQDVVEHQDWQIPRSKFARGLEKQAPKSVRSAATPLSLPGPPQLGDNDSVGTPALLEYLPPQANNAPLRAPLRSPQSHHTPVMSERGSRQGDYPAFSPRESEAASGYAGNVVEPSPHDFCEPLPAPDTRENTFAFAPQPRENTSAIAPTSREPTQVTPRSLGTGNVGNAGLQPMTPPGTPGGRANSVLMDTTLAFAVGKHLNGTRKKDRSARSNRSGSAASDTQAIPFSPRSVATGQTGQSILLPPPEQEESDFMFLPPPPGQDVDNEPAPQGYIGGVAPSRLYE